MKILISCLIISIVILDIGVFLILKVMKESYRFNEDQFKEQHYSQNDIVLMTNHIKALEDKIKHLETRQATHGYKLDSLHKIIKSGNYF